MSSKMMGCDEFPQIARTETARAIYLIDVDTCEIVYMNKSAKTCCMAMKMTVTAVKNVIRFYRD
ncbi:MAG: hypothetical protein ACLRXQ_13725 [Phascolarctobacterium faecium]